ncbi:MAG: hypothetical protein FWF84_08105, partial [Kiritimatiellaeota bacterium]|nr:hypothetical protein [Kiritimatiellota bacterium]
MAAMVVAAAAVSAATVEFVAVDTTTRGQWYAYDYDNHAFEYAYGGLGYFVPVPFDRVPGGSGFGIVTDGTPYGTDTSHIDGRLLHPDGPTLPHQGIWYRSPIMKVTVTAGSPVRVSFYATDYDTHDGSDKENRIFNVTPVDGGDVPLAATEGSMFGKGAYLTWLIDDTVTFNVNCGPSGQTILMGVFLDDPVPSPKTTGIANVAEDAPDDWSAEICGRLLAPAGIGTEVYVCWGTNDAGTVFGDWDEQVLVEAFSPQHGFAIPVANLTATDRYYYNVVATNAYGAKWAHEGASPSFSLGAPAVVAEAADRIGAFSARLNGTLTSYSAPAAVTFFWWEDMSSVTNDIPLGLHASGNVSVFLDRQLNAATTYHYQIHVENEAGDGLSEIATFVTAAVTGGYFATAKSGAWDDPSVWEQGAVPADGAHATVNAGHALTLTWPTFDLASLTVNGTFTVAAMDAAVRATEVTVGGTMTHWEQGATAVNGENEWVADQRVWIVCSNLAVVAGGAIDVSGKGYGRFCGPGATHGENGYGSAGHGGRGSGRTITYGIAEAPVEPGSGGAPNAPNKDAGSGGGIVRIEATGAVTVDGVIAANGGHSGVAWSGAGSGGSVYVTCRTVGGSGVIRANGGGGGTIDDGGGAGGGRVAVVYDTVAQAQVPVPSLKLAADGAFNLYMGDTFYQETYCVPGRGEPGTVCVSDLSFFPSDTITEGFRLVFPEGVTAWAPGNALSISNAWVIFDPVQSFAMPGDMACLGNAWLELGGLSCANLFVEGGAFKGANALTISAGGTNGIIEW